MHKKPNNFPMILKCLSVFKACLFPAGAGLLLISHLYGCLGNHASQWTRNTGRRHGYNCALGESPCESDRRSVVNDHPSVDRYQSGLTEKYTGGCRQVDCGGTARGMELSGRGTEILLWRAPTASTLRLARLRHRFRMPTGRISTTNSINGGGFTKLQP